MTPQEFLIRLMDKYGTTGEITKKLGFTLKAMQSWADGKPLLWGLRADHDAKLIKAVEALGLTQDEINSLKPPVVTGEDIAEMRKEMGLTQEELAEKLGITSIHLRAVERGKVRPYGVLGRIEAQKPLIKIKTQKSTKAAKNATHTIGREPVRIVRINGGFRGFRKFGNEWKRSDYVEENMMYAISMLTGKRFGQ